MIRKSSTETKRFTEDMTNGYDLIILMSSCVHSNFQAVETVEGVARKSTHIDRGRRQLWVMSTGTHITHDFLLLGIIGEKYQITA